MSDHHRKLERMYLGAPINAFYKPTMQIGGGTAVVTMEAASQLHHAANAVHGSALFKLLDDACFFAVSSLVDDVFVFTVSFTTYFVRPVSEGTMTASGKVVHSGKSLFVAEALVLGPNGKEVARGSGSFMKSTIPLTPEIGYA